MRGAPRNARIWTVAFSFVAVLSMAVGCGDDGGVLPTATTTPGTTTPLRPGITLRSDGLGLVPFGASFDSASKDLRDALGAPDSDTTTVADMPDGLGGPKTTLRTLRWGQLSVSFIDWTGSPYRTDGSLHMVRWLLFDGTGSSRTFATPEGARLGSTLIDLQKAYASLIIERDDCVGAWQIRVDNSGRGIVGRLDSAPQDKDPRLVYLAAGLRSSC